MSRPKCIAWFSCGAASAVAAKLAIEKYGRENTRVIRQYIPNEHPDNERFMSEIENWIGVNVEITRSDKYKDVDDVITKTRWIAGVGGARCTGELKRKVAESLINWGPDQETEVLGYTFDERARVKRWIANNNERKIDPILIEHGLTKEDCLGVLWRAGIKIPAMYELGFSNNNCIGCVKGSAGYWNKIRLHFPEVFARRAAQERDIGAAICKVEAIATIAGDFDWPEWVKGLSNHGEHTISKNGKRARLPVFLDELPKSHGRAEKPYPITCGIICASVMDDEWRGS